MASNLRQGRQQLNFYLRALWGRDFFIRPTGAEYTDFRPYIENKILYVPDALDDIKLSDEQGIEGEPCKMIIVLVGFNFLMKFSGKFI
jgi:hypothetical protein